MLTTRLHKVEGTRAADVGALNPNDWRVDMIDPTASRRRAGKPTGHVLCATAAEVDAMQRVKRVAVHRRLGRAARAAGRRRAPGGPGLPLLAHGLPHAATSPAGRRPGAPTPTRWAPAAAKSAVTDLSCWVRAINRHARRDLETAAVDCERLLPRRVHRHRDDLGLPARRLPGHARLRVRAARLLDDRRGRARAPRTFAATMRGADQVLPPSFTHGSSLLAMPPASALKQ